MTLAEGIPDFILNSEIGGVLKEVDELRMTGKGVFKNFIHLSSLLNKGKIGVLQ